MKTNRNSAALFLSWFTLMLLSLNSVFPLPAVDLGGGAGVIGNDSDGTFSRNIDDTQIHGNRFRAPVNMRLTELRARVLELTGTFKCAVYSDAAGVADRLLRSSVAVVNATNGWNTFPLTAPLDLVGGDFYWLVIWADTAGARVVADNVGTYSLGTYSYVALAGEFPDPITLTIGTGDSPERTYCIYSEGSPIGTATGPEMDLRGNGKLIVSGDVSPSALDGTDFGSLNVGSGFQDSTFTIQNVGDAPLALTGTPRVSVTGPEAGDFIVTQPTNSSIAPGGTATFTVRFDPSARGLRTATISITNNDSTENPYTFAVQGGGIAAGRESIFPDTKVFGDVNFDGTYYELGTVFRASVPGKITHLRVYSLASESGDHTARIWRNSDDTVIGGPYIWNYGGVTGWIEFDILDVDIEADTDYTVSISTGTSPLRNYPNLSDLAMGGDNGLHLSYPPDAGKFTETQGARPTSSFNHGDYGRDILFVPSAPPPESLFPDTKVLGDVNFDGTYYELGTVFRASVPGKITHLRVYSLASESGDHTARIWRNNDDTVIGGPYLWNYGGVTGWIEFDILDVEIEADTDYTVSISTGTSPLRNYPNLSDLAMGGNNGLHLSYPADAGKFTETEGARPTSSFNHGDYGRDILFVPSAPPPESLFPDTKVLGDVNFDGTYYELGTVFRASVPGKITHLRVYSLASESGDHTARIWRNNDDTVIGGPYLWNYGGVTGWIEFDILDVEIEADTDYTVSISTGTSPLRNYPNLSDLAMGGSNGLHLSYPADAGKFTETEGARPTSSFNHGDYGRDIVFVPGTEAGDITYRFDDVTEDFFIIDGVHGGIDFGTGAWTGFLNVASLTKSASYSTPAGVFTLPAGKVLKAVRLSSISGGTWRISDGVNPERTGTFAASATPVWVITDWQTAAAVVTVEAGFFPGDGLIDDIAYGDPSTIAPVHFVQITADQITGNVVLRWEGGEDRFQVLKATSIEGPFVPLSGLLSLHEFTDVGALQGPDPCSTASAGGSWVNRPFSNQTGAFTAQFDATPSAAPIDSVMALSSGPQTTFGGLACLARFNPDGNIDARNGGIYTAASVIPYAANVKYSFRFVVDIPSHLYSVYVTPAGGVEQTVGADFAFRSEQSAVTNLNNWAVTVASPTGTNTVCNFTDGGAAPQGTSQSFYRVRGL